MPVSPPPPPPPRLKSLERVVLFDGVCPLCNAWVNFLILHDTSRKIRFAAIQSAEGQALLNLTELPLDKIETMVYFKDGQPHLRSEAFLLVMRELPPPWHLISALKHCPQTIRDWCYDKIARNRYRFFGRYDTCLLPTADHEKRFLDFNDNKL